MSRPQQAYFLSSRGSCAVIALSVVALAFNACPYAVRRIENAGHNSGGGHLWVVTRVADCGALRRGGLYAVATAACVGSTPGPRSHVRLQRSWSLARAAAVRGDAVDNECVAETSVGANRVLLWDSEMAMDHAFARDHEG